MTAILDAPTELLRLKRYQWDCRQPGCDGRPHMWMPFPHAREAQVVHGDKVTAFITGRGFGKTRSAAEWAKMRMLRQPKHRLNIMVPTFAIGRDVCVEGESGLLAVMPPEYVKTWNRSMGEMVLHNGSRLKIFGCNTQADAEAVRGSQSHSLWAEEIATWRYQQLGYDMAQLGNRLGSDTQTVVTTTPKPTPVIKKLLKGGKARIVTGSTYDNADNLDDGFIDYIRDAYEGTRLGQQEIQGLLLEDIIGALWKRELILYADPESVLPSQMERILVSVDPAGSHKLTSDRSGIVVVGRLKGKLYVFEDRSGRYTPNGWAEIAVRLYESYGASAVIAETNFGADMVENTLRGIDRHINFKAVHASRGKAARAEPVVGLYEQQKVYHVGPLPELENEMCSWVPPGQTEIDARDGSSTPVEASKTSPDRVDALVWAATELLLSERKPRAVMRFEQ